jgi:hypothetical protein
MRQPIVQTSVAPPARQPSAPETKGEPFAAAAAHALVTRQDKNTREGRDYLQRLPRAALQPRREERQHTANVAVQLLRAE